MTVQIYPPARILIVGTMETYLPLGVQVQNDPSLTNPPKLLEQAPKAAGQNHSTDSSLYNPITAGDILLELSDLATCGHLLSWSLKVLKLFQVFSHMSGLRVTIY